MEFVEFSSVLIIDFYHTYVVAPAVLRAVSVSLVDRLILIPRLIFVDLDFRLVGLTYNT